MQVSGAGKKNAKQVLYSRKLGVGQYCIQAALKDKWDGNAEYELADVVAHHGTELSGHFYHYQKLPDGQWLQRSGDLAPKRVAESHVMTRGFEVIALADTRKAASRCEVASACRVVYETALVCKRMRDQVKAPLELVATTTRQQQHLC